MLGGIDETAVGAETHVALRLLAVRGHSVPHELVRAGPRYAVDGEGEAGVLQRAHVARAHQATHQAAHVVVAHGRLELGGADGRVAEPSGGSHRPLRQRSELEKRYLELGWHGRV